MSAEGEREAHGENPAGRELPALPPHSLPSVVQIEQVKIQKNACGWLLLAASITPHRGHSLVVKRYPSKLDMRVRFPLPAFSFKFPARSTPFPTMKMTARFAAFSAILGLLSIASVKAEDNCNAQSASLKEAITAKPSEMLQLVEVRVSANPGCACEIVKTAIEVSKADVQTVASIVETAAAAAPDKMRLIAQCALAVAPDALAGVQAVLAKLDPSSGESGASSKDAKSSKEPQVADTWNPLDFPGDDPKKTTTGGYEEFPPGPGPGPGGFINNPLVSPTGQR